MPPLRPLPQPTQVAAGQVREHTNQLTAATRKAATFLVRHPARLLLLRPWRLVVVRCIAAAIVDLLCWCVQQQVREAARVTVVGTCAVGLMSSSIELAQCKLRRHCVVLMFKSSVNGLQLV